MSLLRSAAEAFCSETLAELRAIRAAVERPLMRDQLRIGTYLLQTHRVAGAVKWIGVITQDGERRIFAEADLEGAIRQFLTRSP